MTEQQTSEKVLAVKVAELERAHRAMLNLLEDNIQAQRQLAKANANDEAMLASIGDGLIAMDTQGRITLVNEAFETMVGYTADEVKGKKIVDALGAINEKGVEIRESDRPINIVLRERTKAFKGNMSYKRKNGTFFAVSVAVSPIISKGDFIGVVEVFHDTTKEREVDRSKTELISLASHQLRTPLTAISWYTEMLLTGAVDRFDEKQRKYLSEVYAGNQRMVELVDALLDVSRLELGTFVVKPETTDFVRLIQSEIDEQKLLIDSKRMHLRFTFEKNIPTLVADPKLLRTIVQNLLSNSLKYTPEGGAIEISLSIEVVDGQQNDVLLKISDSGYGIPKHQQEKIFTKLFRADNARLRNTQGTGLGLYIVKSIVENSRGSIWFESEENKGTTFYVTLPLKYQKEGE